MTPSLGRPFSRPYQDLIAGLEERIRQGVEQPASKRVLFKGGTLAYDLPRDVFDVSQVTGLSTGAFTVFRPGTDYRFSNGQIQWTTTGDLPDDLTRFDVEYTYLDRPAGLTDFNPGSVVGTLVRAFARELKVMYEQMDEAYRRAFIDQASGVALDNVVALLNVVRNPAQKAEGRVTFLRKKAASTPVVIPPGTRVATEGQRVFATTERGEIPLEKDETVRASAGKIQVSERIAAVVGVWTSTQDPSVDPPLALLAPPADPEFGADERTISFNGGVTPPGDLLARYKPRTATVAIEALEEGPDGNVNSGAITIMPTPPSGIDQGVTNDQPTTGGFEAETDDALRERAKHELERAGKATLNAIKFAVLDVDGVEGVEVLDHTVDGNIPLGEVQVRYSYSGLDPGAIARAVDDTRAAGIMPRLEAVRGVLIKGTWYVILDEESPPGAADAFVASAVEALGALKIGEPVSVRRLNALVFRVTGLADVAEAQLQYQPQTPLPLPAFVNLPDPYLTLPTELVRPDPANLKAEPIAWPAALVTRRVGLTNEIDLRLVKRDASAVRFTSFALDLTFTLKARLQSTPDLPPERIKSLTRRVTFTNQDLLTFVLPDGDVLDAPGVPGFRVGDHAPEVEVVIEASAYRGLGSVKAQILLPAI